MATLAVTIIPVTLRGESVPQGRARARGIAVLKFAFDMRARSLPWLPRSLFCFISLTSGVRASTLTHVAHARES